MTERGVPIARPLDAGEKQLLCDLAVQEVVQKTGCSFNVARDVLRELANKGELLFVGDYTTVKVCNSAGGVFVEAARDWLAFETSFAGRDRDDVGDDAGVHQHDDRGDDADAGSADDRR